MSKYRLVALTLLLMAAGCTFSPPELAPVGSGEPGPPDAGPSPNPEPDASPPCQADELRLELRIGGTLVSDEPGPYVEALVGDVVEISAAGSCAGGGEVSYEWTITPSEDIAGSAQPALAGGPETFTVYPATAGAYQVGLTVRGPDGETREASALAIRAHEWRPTMVPPQVEMGEIRGLAVGRGYLWLAAENGPFLHRLEGPVNAFAPVVSTGSMIPGNLSDVIFDDRTGFLWFGSAADTSGPWRLSTGNTTLQSLQIPFDVPTAIGMTAQTHDFVAYGTDTVAVATSKGITAVDGTEGTFAGQTRPDGQDPVALAAGAGRRLAGSRALYDLDTGGALDVGVGGSDSRIVTMAIDAADEVLWIGTDGLGVVAFDLRDDVAQAIYNEDNSNLGSDTVHDVLVETEGPCAGDVWAATDSGVSRYISRRNTWMHMDQDDGLSGHLDLNALAIEHGENGRVVYGGSTAGVVYIGVP